MTTNYTIRELSVDPGVAFHEVQACVAVQRAVGWAGESVPSHVIRADSMGRVVPGMDLGLVLLVEHAEKGIVGFCRVSYTGQAGQMHLHEIAIVPETQSSGVGFDLMQQIRAHCLARGAKRLLFTFDPMDKRNLFFYIQKCGIRAIHLLGDFYEVGDSTNLPFVFLARWNLSTTSNPSVEVEEVNFPELPLSGTSSFCYRLPAFPAALSHSDQEKWHKLLTQFLNHDAYELVALPAPEGNAFLFVQSS